MAPQSAGTHALSDAEGQALLRLARRTLERALLEGDFSPADLEGLPDRLLEPGAAFVTLSIGGELRGCIGSVEARRPLAQDVAENALCAAFSDPRFAPLTPEELTHLDIEISILTPLQPLIYSDHADLVRQLRPGVDGVLISRGRHRGLLLPQVWERISDPGEFLAHVCLKAGLAPDAYRQSRLDVYVFQVQRFEASYSELD